MKKLKTLLYTLFSVVLSIGLTSCGSGLNKKDHLVISDVHKLFGDTGKDCGRYKYEFYNSELEIWSDSLYSVGDTLKIGRK
jgi:hypothetical protein